MMRKYYIGMFALVILTIASCGLNYGLNVRGASDVEALDDISRINDEINNYVNDKKQLPKDLTELKLDKLKVDKRLDKYAYKDLGEVKNSEYETSLAYELCATFTTNKAQRGYGTGYDEDSYEGGIDSSSSHPKGYHCFKFKSYLPFEDDTSSTSLFNSSNTLKQEPQCGPLQETLFEKPGVEITGIHLEPSQLYTKGSSVNSIVAYQWCYPLTVVDKNNKVLTIKDLTIGDIVTISGGGTMQIQKIKLENR
ncbi:MAG: hypothetical protein ACR2FM_00615 [Candidatus Saccharimonadales bacterium]